MSDARINVGDKVTVDLGGDGSRQFDGIVRYIPQDTGDAWRIETEATIVYVQTYQTIWKVKVAP